MIGTRHSSTPPTTNNNTSEMIEARSLCVTPATTAMSSGPEHGRELAHHVVEAEELRVLALRHQPAEQRTRQALHAALHETHGHGQRIELADRIEEVRVHRDARVHREPDENAALRSDAIAEIAEEQRRRETPRTA